MLSLIYQLQHLHPMIQYAVVRPFKVGLLFTQRRRLAAGGEEEKDEEEKKKKKKRRRRRRGHDCIVFTM